MTMTDHSQFMSSIMENEMGIQNHMQEAVVKSKSKSHQLNQAWHSC